jgi:hypothetical protein
VPCFLLSVKNADTPHEASGFAASARALNVCSIVALVLLTTLVAIVPLAYASPPDPTWVPGFYDGADFDEAVLAIVSAEAAPTPDPPILLVSNVVVLAAVQARPLVRDHCPELTADRSPPLIAA